MLQKCTFAFELKDKGVIFAFNKRLINEKMKKAVILSRVSTALQDYEQQTNEVVKECIKDGYSESDIISIEDMESGVKLDEEHRLGLNKLKELVEHDNSIATVYAYEISRIGRRPEVNYSIRNFLQSHKVQLIILKPYIRVFKSDFTIDVAGNMIFSIFNALAENEGYLRKERLARGKRFKRELGRWVAGAVTFGYKTDKEKKIVVDKEASNVVKSIFQMYLNKGMSTRAIAKELMASGYFRFLSKETVTVKVCRTLNNRIYTGLEDERFEALITEDEYNRAQEKLKTKRTHTLQTRKTNMEYWCKGLVTNGLQNYTVHSSLNRYQTKNGSSVQREVLHEAVTREMRKYYENTKLDVKELIKDTMEKIQEVTRKLEYTYSEINRIEQMKQKIWERNIEGRISDEKAKKMEEKSVKDLLELERSKKVYEEEKHKLSLDAYFNEDGSLVDMTLDFEKMSDEEKYNAVHRVFEKIIVKRIGKTRKKKIKFVYKAKS